MAAGKMSTGKIIGIIALVVVGGVVVITWLGYMPGLSAFFGTAKQRDLGITADKAAFESAMQKAGVSAEYPASPVSVEQVKVSGSKKIDGVSFTDDEVSALINAYLEPFGYDVSKVQVVFREGGTGDASAMVVYNGKPYPGYITGTVAYGGTITGTAASATGGGISASGKWLGLGQDKTLEFMNLQLAFPGLAITKAELGDGVVVVSGTVPEKITLQ